MYITIQQAAVVSITGHTLKTKEVSKLKKRIGFILKQDEDTGNEFYYI